MDERVRLVMEADPDWTRGDQRQLLRLLFGPRVTARRGEPQVMDAASVVSCEDSTEKATSSVAGQATELI